MVNLPARIARRKLKTNKGDHFDQRKISKFKEIGVWDAVSGGNLISRNLLTNALTKDDTYEYQCTFRDDYTININ